MVWTTIDVGHSEYTPHIFIFSHAAETGNAHNKNDKFQIIPNTQADKCHLADL